METPTGIIQPTTSQITRLNKWDHFLARIGYKRQDHRVQPGLYALGNPTVQSQVFVTANYTLSFDALRSALSGVQCFILVLDTKGINVWCAAGKGTFGTEELVRSIKSAELAKVVEHRTILLPQLGAPGVAAHEVQKQTGFKVQYGPVRADDLPAYLKTGDATPAMRQVRFTLSNRLTVTPVEMFNLKTILIVSILVWLNWNSPLMVALMLTIWLGGTLLFPVLLPWIPTKEFTTKGFLLGILLSVLFWAYIFTGTGNESLTSQILRGIYSSLLLTSSIGFLALNFTGSSTYTSRTGVKREIFRYIPLIAVLFVVGFLLTIMRSLLASAGVI